MQNLLETAKVVKFFIDNYPVELWDLVLVVQSCIYKETHHYIDK